MAEPAAGHDDGRLEGYDVGRPVGPGALGQEVPAVDGDAWDYECQMDEEGVQ